MFGVCRALGAQRGEINENKDRKVEIRPPEIKEIKLALEINPASNMSGKDV